MKIVWFVLEAIAAIVRAVFAVLDLALRNQSELNSHLPIDDRDGYDR
ncbi:hypothetical protein [Deinococcus humi]|uniref:Uncharacterized protein n=1 Tax=Deinococcus humi TaxID=662880 RepID=A0A7W8JYR1_9DEIO|nr:hypothetical protein [Deinococcus humi]MBB5365691.1 hypothetical protein [Deinococcus humi]GGO37142.1 hypothetical protein GCM10008949_41980 [Deinococcus humi]